MKKTRVRPPIKLLALCLCTAMYLPYAPALHGQDASTLTPEPGFTLTLSQAHDGAISFPQIMLIVKYTNTSGRFKYSSRCAPGLYKIVVVYNGVLQKEPEAAKKRREKLEDGYCLGMPPRRNLQPDQSREDSLYYDATKPGTYQFTVERETEPHYPLINVTVKSNTITVVVPKQGSAPPNGD